MKATTTSLYKCLSEHHDVMSSFKEVEFLNRNWIEGRFGYEEHFQMTVEAMAVGEAFATSRPISNEGLTRRPRSTGTVLASGQLVSYPAIELWQTESY